MIQTFDKDKKYSISFNEFLMLILPKYNSQIQKNCLNKPYHIIDQSNITSHFSNEVFVSIIQIEISIQELINNCINEIYKNGFLPIEAFVYISKGANEITTNLLHNFLLYRGNTNNREYSSNEINNLIFKLDLDNDKAINFIDFKNILSLSAIENSDDLYDCSINTYLPSKKYHHKNQKGKVNPIDLIQKNSFDNNSLDVSLHKINRKYNTYFENNSYNQINKKVYKKQTIKTVREHLIYCFSDLIKFEASIEILKESLCLENDINIYALYSFFSINQSNSISLEEISLSLKQLGCILSNDANSLLFKRYDLNKDKLLE